MLSLQVAARRAAIIAARRHQLYAAGARFQTTGVNPPPPPASSESDASSSSSGDKQQPTKKKMGIGAKIADWIVDNPGLFFGGLFGSLIAYIVHGSVGGNRREKAITELEKAAPIASKEIAEVGKANSVTRAVFERVVDRSFQLCPTGIASPLELSLLFRRELAAAADLSGGSASNNNAKQDHHPLQLPKEHHLRRAAAVIAQNNKNNIATAAEGPVGSSETAPATPAPSAEVIDSGAVDLPLLQLLSLYGTTMGGRPEKLPPAPANGNGDNGDLVPLSPYPSPSERLDMWLALVRRGQHACIDSAASGSVSNDSGGSISTLDVPPGMVSEQDLIAVTDLLMQTYQVPPRARVHQVGTWPFPSYGPRAATDHVSAAIAELKIDDERTKAAKKLSEAVTAGRAPPDGAAASKAVEADEALFIDPGTLSPCPSKHALTGARLFSHHEAVRLMLRSKAVCAWNECNERWPGEKQFD